MLRKLQKHIPYGASVADIYAGAGVIGLSLAVTRKCKYVHLLCNECLFPFRLRSTVVVKLSLAAAHVKTNFMVFMRSRSVKCIEINKESKVSFEKSISRLPKSVDGNISWHHADASIVSY